MPRAFPPPNWIDDYEGWIGEDHGWLTPSGWRDVMDPAREGMDCSEDGRASDGKQAYAFDFVEAVSAWASDPTACHQWWTATPAPPRGSLSARIRWDG